MSKLHAARVVGKGQVEDLRLPEQVEVSLHQLAGAVKQGLLAFSVGIGFEVMGLMMRMSRSPVNLSDDPTT